jgi:16S rRNA (cytidine1402-2'-O)-methyltransferase
MTTESHGVLYVVSTPIGNLDDLSPRARQMLAKVEVVAAEDTRRTRGLLSSIGANRTLIAYHDHNESRRTPQLLARLKRGESVALVSDAGTPLISDPGLKLVQAALADNLRVVAIPGPSAVLAALAISGLPTDRFVFEGFLPSRAAARRARLEGLREERRTLVFFEAVHRIEAALADLAAVFGGARPAALARELTKLHEAVYPGTLESLSARLGEAIPLKGEFVLVVAGDATPVSGDMAEAQRVFAVLAAELPTGQAARLTAAITGVKRNAVYRLTHGEAD